MAPHNFVLRMAAPEAAARSELEDLAEGCLARLESAVPLALGPVVSVDFTKAAVEAEFSVEGSPSEAEATARLIGDSMTAAKLTFVGLDTTSA